MKNETATEMQNKFKAMSDDYRMRASFGYFLDTDGSALITYNNISDNETLYLCSAIIRRIARKRNTTTDDIIEIMRLGMADEDNTLLN